MQRKELKKEIKKYSHEIKFYKLGLVRRLVKLKEKRMKAFIEAIPKVVCPKCGSRRIDVAHADEYWDSSHWLVCKICGEDFDDTFGFEDALQEIRTEPYFDIVLLTVDEINWSKEDPSHYSVNKEYLKFGVV